MVGRNEVVADEQGRCKQATALDIIRVVTKIGEHGPHVCRAAIIDRRDADSDRAVVTCPVPDRQLDGQDFVAGRGREREQLSKACPTRRPALRRSSSSARTTGPAPRRRGSRPIGLHDRRSSRRTHPSSRRGCAQSLRPVRHPRLHWPAHAYPRRSIHHASFAGGASDVAGERAPGMLQTTRRQSTVGMPEHCPRHRAATPVVAQHRRPQHVTTNVLKEHAASGPAAVRVEHEPVGRVSRDVPPDQRIGRTARGQFECHQCVPHHSAERTVCRFGPTER